MTTGFTREDQIACVKREIAMRKSVYPKWIASGKLKQEKADAEIACMQSIYELLADLHREEQWL